MEMIDSRKNITITKRALLRSQRSHHNLFSVGQFCGADLEVDIRKSNVFLLENIQGNDLTNTNGRCRRRNRTLVEDAQTMLSTSKLPLFFWAEASQPHAILKKCGENLERCMEKGIHDFGGDTPLSQEGLSCIQQSEQGMIVNPIHLRFDDFKRDVETDTDHAGCLDTRKSTSGGIQFLASSTALLQRILSSLHQEFDMTDLGAHDYFLGISITRDSIIIMEYLVKISRKARILELKRRHLKILTLTSYTPYPSRKIRCICALHKRPRRNKDQYSVSRRSLYAVIKEEFEKLESLKIGDDSFACNTSFEIFHKEFNRMSRMDDDLFTYEVHERPWTDNEAWEEPTPVRHHCEPFNYKNECSEWPTCSWKDDGYYNGGNLPGAYIVGNTLRYQDLEWYEALKDSKLKEEALKNKAIMKGIIDEDDESNNEG
ncbi:putative reverse transcriptase domain-containing protein [Tanacetum coccineum]